MLTQPLALGAEADRVRWFPVLDENGNIIPKKAQPTEAPELSNSEQMVEPE